jgi:preprotein translocase subunit SecB
MAEVILFPPYRKRFMSDQAQQETQQPVFQIQRVYLKDMSLEQPNSPQIFLEQEAPAIEVAIDVSAEALAEGLFESTVTVTVTAKIKDKVAFLVEGKQAGIFEARNIPDEQLDPLLGIGCPNIVYPYLRANIADAITRAGFPPVHLSEINFEVFYQQRLQAMAEQAHQQNGSGLVMPDGSSAAAH